jgi:hypothetical protein
MKIACRVDPGLIRMSGGTHETTYRPKRISSSIYWQKTNPIGKYKLRSNAV